MSLISRNLDFFDDMDEVFDTSLDRFIRLYDYPTKYNRGYINKFSLDIIENSNDYEVVIDLPGFDTNDITIENNNGYLTISAEKNFENSKQDKNKKWFRKERNYSKFHKSFMIPQNVDYNKIDAVLDKGVLSIILPKLKNIENKKSKRITIKTTKK